MKKLLSIFNRPTAKDSVVAFLFKGFGLFFSFLFNMLIARFYGASVTGVYFMALNFITIGFTISTYGFQNTVLKEVSFHFAINNNSKVYKVLRFCLTVSIVLATVVTLALIATSTFFQNTVFHSPGLASGINYLSGYVLFVTVILICAEYLRGVNELYKCFLVKDCLAGGISCVILLIFKFFNAGDLSIYISYVGGIASVAVLTIYFVAKSIKKLNLTAADNSVFTYNSIKSMSWNFFVISAMNTIAKWNDVFFIGLFEKSADVGVFAIAKRTAYLVSFFAVATNSVITPKFAQYFAKGEYFKLKRLYKNSIVYLSIFSVPILGVTILSTKFILSLFGHEFMSGVSIFIIIMIGQVISIITGPCTFVLSMIGQEKILRKITVAFTLVYIVGSFFAIKYFGILGAALANLIFISSNNIVNFLIVVKKLNTLAV